MIDKISLEATIKALEAKHPLSKQLGLRFQEWKKNFFLEAGCIGMCELGDILFTFTADGAAEIIGTAQQVVAETLLQYDDLIGFAGGLSFGMGFAYWHTLKHGRENKADASKLDALLYASIAESSCITGATATTALMSAQAPGLVWHVENMGKRLLSLPFALAIGLVAMSECTLPKRDVAYRAIGEKDALEELHKPLEAAFKKYDLTVQLDEKRIIIPQVRSPLVIQEKTIPRSYQNDFDPATHSLYVAKSRACRYSPRAKTNVANVVSGCFEIVGKPRRPLRDIFAHNH